MHPSQQRTSRIATGPPALKTAVVYAVLGMFWVLGSNRVVQLMSGAPEAAARASLLTGGLLVVVTALWVGWMLFRVLGTKAEPPSDPVAPGLAEEQEAQQRFERLFQRNPMPMALSEPTELRFTDVNAAWLSALGYERHEVIGRTSRDLDLFPDLDEPQKTAARLLQSGSISNVELQVRARDGRLLDGLFSGELLTYQGKERLLTVMVDLTARKRAEEALRRSEERYRSMFDDAADGILLMSADGGTLRVNKAFARMHGYDDPREMESLRLQDLDAPASALLTMDRVRRVTDGAILTFEAEHFCKDGSTVPLSVTASRVEMGGAIYLQAFHRDIRQQKQAEAALRRSELRYRRLVENAPDGLVVLAADTGRFLAANPAALTLYGAPTETDLISRTPWELSPEHQPDGKESRAKALEMIEVAARDGFIAFEWTHRRISGEHFLATVQLVRVEQGDQAIMQATVRDITERKRLEAQLRQAQKLEAVGQLAGGVAHDFNNILAAIMMHLGLLRMNHAADAETLQSLRELETEARRAATLTRQLLMFSRRSVLAVKPLDVNEVVANLLKMLGRLIGETISLRFDGGPALPQVQADAGMLEQVLMNLVVNARDAMPRGGRITIATSCLQVPADHANIQSDRRAGRFVCLTVSDEGTGMDEETLKRIFEPFFTTKEAGKGTGLGLATVHGIAAQHGGWVEVESAVGQGATFRVLLPAATAPATADTAPAGPATAPRGKETILVVEDEQTVRRLVCRTLRALGYRVHEAGTGKEAMQVWQTSGADVDLLLTDMVMPEGMTGLELVEQLQRSKPGLKAIITSGYSAEIVHAGAPTRTGIAYLPKPYGDSTLAEIVRRCLDQSG